MDEFQDAAMAFISGGVPCAKDCTILAPERSSYLVMLEA
jgi:hypothetical protein